MSEPFPFDLYVQMKLMNTFFNRDDSLNNLIYSLQFKTVFM